VLRRWGLAHGPVASNERTIVVDPRTERALVAAYAPFRTSNVGDAVFLVDLRPPATLPLQSVTTLWLSVQNAYKYTMMAVDSSRGRVFLAYQNHVLVFDSRNGHLLGQVDLPAPVYIIDDVAVAESTGRLFVVDWYDSAVMVLDTDQLVAAAAAATPVPTP
jgi:DNA-binding beta-propeller fold protein YncE